MYKYTTKSPQIQGFTVVLTKISTSVKNFLTTWSAGNQKTADKKQKSLTGDVPKKELCPHTKWD